MLVQYIRDENKVPFGVVVAVQDDDGHVRFGVSLKSPKDHWNRDLGRKIAIGRAYAGVICPQVPLGKEFTVLAAVSQMMKRSKQYFKGATFDTYV